MKLDVTLCHSILKYCFNHSDSFITANKDAMNLWREIEKNRITLNDDLLTCYEIEFEKDENSQSLDMYQQLIATETTKPADETLICGNDLTNHTIDTLLFTDDYLQILVNLAYSTFDKIIFSDLLSPFQTQLEPLGIFPMDKIKILDRNQTNYYNDYHFPYNREIQTGEQSSNLSKWFNRILKDEDNITILDPYLYQNRVNLKNHILSNVKNGANLIFYTEFTRDRNLSRSDKKLRATDFQTEFASSFYSNWNIVNVYSVLKIELHDRIILTDNYIIKIGKGLSVFGNSVLTERCNIDAYYRSTWNGTLPTPVTTII